jgi:peptidoglycan/xylan/chitin deacetylase (PgdA/CDA1 family)
MISNLRTIAKPALKKAVISAGLEASALMAGLGIAARGVGAIFTLHHVRPKSANLFQPNDILEITPDFLEEAILTLKDEGYAFARLEDVPRRLAAGNSQPFACFTLDDGYHDNVEFAAPLFSRYQVPFTIFITQGYVEATHTMWWETIDAVLNEVERLEFDFGQGPETMPAMTPAQKLAVFNRIADFVNSSDEREAVAQLDAVALASGVDPLAITRDLAMRADELRVLAENTLVSYGAHTISHRGLARLSDEEATREIVESAEALAAVTGKRPISFAYPYGDGRSVSAREQRILAENGLSIGVTTRPGVLKPGMTSDMTALPRISLNGLYQKARYVRGLASGLPFKVMG